MSYHPPVHFYRGVGDEGPGPEPSDIDLLNAHVAGDPHAFAVLFRRHRNHLWHVATRTSYSSEDAADALQDAMLSAHRTAASFRQDAAVRSWLHTIVVNACLDRIRRAKTRPTQALSADEDDHPPTRHDEASAVETRLMIHQALDRLPDDQRLAVVTVDIEGHPVADAARILGVPPGTVKSRCARGRKKLAQSLEYFRHDGNRS